MGTRREVSFTASMVLVVMRKIFSVKGERGLGGRSLNMAHAEHVSSKMMSPLSISSFYICGDFITATNNDEVLLDRALGDQLI